MSELAAMARHFADLDPELPTPTPPVGRSIGALSVRGTPLLGVWSELVHDAASSMASWSALHTATLHPLIGNGCDLDPLLRQWREVLSTHSFGSDSACSVVWPSRDIAATRALLDHGFVPLTVLAIRCAEPASAASTTSIHVRDGTGADLTDLLRLTCWELDYAAQVGAAVVRESAREQKAEATARWIASDSPVLVAEVEGNVVGMLQYRCSRVGTQHHQLVRPGRWAYLHCLSVRPDERGRGVGAALVAEMNRRLVQDGVADVCLYFNPANPLSSVFWPRQGYRPLWTCWEVRPAKALR